MSDAASLMAPLAGSCCSCLASSVGSPSPPPALPPPTLPPLTVSAGAVGLAPLLVALLVALLAPLAEPEAEPAGPRSDLAPVGGLAKEADPSDGGAAGARLLGVEGARANQAREALLAVPSGGPSDAVPAVLPNPLPRREGVAGGEGVSASSSVLALPLRPVEPSDASRLERVMDPASASPCERRCWAMASRSAASSAATLSAASRRGRAVAAVLAIQGGTGRRGMRERPRARPNCLAARGAQRAQEVGGRKRR